MRRGWSLAVALGGVVATAGVVMRRRAGRRQPTAGRPPGPETAGRPPEPGTGGGDGDGGHREDRASVMVTGRVGRGLEVARMTSRVGTGYVADRARAAVSGPERAGEVRSERQLRTAAEVVETLGSMKGAFMKIGQMASYLDAGMPPNVRDVLARLQADAPPMTAELAASVVRDELGAPPDRVFASWDPVPLAAASIGQVHRAVTRDGQEVAVKIQYPGIDEAIRSDLDNSTMLLSLIRMAFPSLDAPSLVAELRARVVEELDYTLEASNQMTFATRFAGHPFIHVPRVIAPLSARRVLTSELVEGTRYDEVVATWSQEERDLAGETIFRFVFGCLYRLRVFNGDPHPGNYLFHGDGRVSFLDFGLVKWFSDDDVVTLADMVRFMVTEPDPAAFRRAVEAAGFLRPGADLSDTQIRDYFSHYYELVLEGGRTSFSQEYASETLRHFFDAGDPVLKAANVPPPFVILQRINLGLYAVLAGLGSVADWRGLADEIWPFVAAPPRTRLGRAEEAWRQEAYRRRTGA